MNLVGKILIVLILVMSLVFMTAAVLTYSVHRNWREVVERPREQAVAGQPLGLKFQLADAQSARQALETQKANLEQTLASERAARAQQVAKLETEKTTLQAERDQLLQEEAQLKQDLREAIASVQAAQAMLDAKLKEVEQLRADINTRIADRNSQFEQVVAKTDELNQALVELQRLQDTNIRLSEMIARAKLVLERNGMNVDTPVDHIPPDLDGVVLASGANGMVELSLGSDDGLARGHKLLVYRPMSSGPKYLGQVEVMQTQPDRAVAKVLPETRRGNIERNDRFATRIN